jgi:SAM-dependent methyltransferase
MTTRSPLPVSHESIKPISHASTNQRAFELATRDLRPGQRIVDVGAGQGYFSQLVGEHVARTFGVTPDTMLSACDLYPEQFRYTGVRCDPTEPSGRLRYPDGGFDVACSIEVIEHIEDQFQFVRELHRVLRPGGRAIISTPNLLNINSRLRYLHSGFWLLFDPLSLTSRDPVHTSGHIGPISYYYLAYLCHRAGFSRVRVHYDRRKRSAMAWGALLLPFVTLGNAGFRRRLEAKKPEVARENETILDAMGSWDMLTSRSIVVEAVK